MRAADVISPTRNISSLSRIYAYITFRILLPTNATPAAWKAALCCCIWHIAKPPKPGVSRFGRPDVPGPLLPCEAIRPVSDENISVRGRSGPGKGLLAAGAYLRVSGPSGPLMSAYACVQRFLFLSDFELSTSESWGPLGFRFSA